jgi:hypothetical protein
MQAANIVERQGLSSRIVCLLFIAILQVLLIFGVVKTFQRLGWGSAWIAALLTLVLFSIAYDIATRGKPTRRTMWILFALVVGVLAGDIFKLWHHALRRDPFWTMFSDTLWVVICAACIRRNPFETKPPGSIKSSVSILRD